jgi:hypothetical protein
MSQENLEIARRMVALLNEQGAEEAIEALSDLYQPDAEGYDHQPAPGMPAHMHGRAAIIAMTRQWMEVLDNWKVEIHEYIDADPWVVSDVHWHAIGKGSDIPIDWRVVEAHKLQDGKVIRSLWGFSDVAAALEAVELSEQDAQVGS